MIRRAATYAVVIVGAWLAGAEAVIWRLRRWERHT